MNKIETIKQYITPILTAFDSYLKQTNELAIGATLAEKDIDIKALQTLQEDRTRYENLRNKLSSGDFNLSPAEIASVGVILFYQSKVIERQISILNELNGRVEAIYKELLKAN